MRRNYLRQGDQSSAGGVITEGIPDAFNSGVPIAFVGAAVYCPACKTVGHVAPAGPRWPGKMMGKQVALHGDICICKCSSSPTMIAPDPSMSQSFDATQLASLGYDEYGSPTATQTATDAQTPLGGAEAFEYPSPSVDRDGFLMAGAEGTPGNNQAQNKQFNAVVKQLGLDKRQARLLHEDITGENLGYHEIMERAQDMFGGGE
ncbi:PAAR domain-containing protein [Robbsia andropogonis]|uniref:PAAR domain-containing protein n=1 Tax=Robbsia andropogonis TaxID=28092 RepID=UPI0009DF8ED9|nr:PAAR domain-containing protein [Robbsia andropogonis]